MSPVLLRSAWRHGVRHPWLVLLGALGVALGIAVVTAIDLTRASASRSFEQAAAAVTGRATHHIVGGPMGVDEAFYVQLRHDGLADHLAPVIETSVSVGVDAATSMRLLGVDPFAEADLRGFGGASIGGEGPMVDLVTRPGTTLISRRAATRLGLQAGDRLAIATGTLTSELEIIGLLRPDERSPALAGAELLVVDIATAQEVLGMAGRLSRIDLVLDDPDRLAVLSARLPPGMTVVNAAARSASAAGLTGAFYTNLQALSLMALLVGAFLIYNSQSFLVVRRRRQFGILRALGVTRRELVSLVLVEALVLGILGTLVGLVMGTLLAVELLGLVTRTVNDLYHPLAESGLKPDGLMLAKALLLGIGGSLVAGLVPALEAGRVEPRSAFSRANLEAHARTGARAALVTGIIIAAAGGVVLLLPLRSLVAGFVGLFMVVIGAALVTPALTCALSLGLGRMPWLRDRPAARLAVRGVASSLSRTGVAAAALMVAVATTVGIGIMVNSFRTSVEQWLGQFLQADYYVSAAVAAGTETGVTMDRELVRAVASVPGVIAVSHVRHLSLNTADGPRSIAAFQLNPRAQEGFVFLERLPEPDLWRAFNGGDGVFVTESYAWRHRVVAGDAILLPAAAGAREFRVLGIYRDYGSDRGRISMSRATYDRHWPGDRAVDGIGVYAGPGFDEQELRARMAGGGGKDRQLELVANREIREASLAVFDRTFTITEVLRMLAGIIAFIGVFSALLAIQLERTRELGVLKALGILPSQLRGIVLGETALVGSVAGGFAVPVGVVLAVVLIEVINRRSFGWGMAIQLDGGVMISGVTMAIVAALLAGLYPAARMSRIQPADALRTE